MKKPLLLLLLLYAMFCLPAKLYAQIASWQFNVASTTVLVTATANTSDPGLSTAPILTRGAGAVGNGAGNSFRTTGFKNDGIATTNTDYFEVKLSAAAGNKLSLSSINASFNGTAAYFANPGVTHQFAYSLDGTNFTLIGTATQLTGGTPPIVMPALNLSGESALQNVPSGTTVTLRYYASGQTSTGGWGFFSNNGTSTGLAIGGSVSTAGADVTPPVNTAGYPKINNITSTSVDLTSNINEAGKTYYILIPASGVAPTTAAQIKAGTDGNGTAAFKSGSFANTANTDASATIGGLTLSTSYKIYSVSEDVATPANLQSTFSSLSATTLGATDVTPPVNTTGYPKTANLTTTSVDLISNINEAGTTYYVLSLAGGAAPTAVQVKAGLDGSGAAAFKAGSFANPANTDASATINGLSPGTAYTIYSVSADAAATPNLQTAVSTLNITTVNLPLVNAPVIISQYYEGTSTNKWIELTNLSDSPVNTASPQLKLGLYNISGDAGPINISGNPTQIMNLNVIIPPKGTVLIGNTGNGNEVPYITAASAAQTSNTVINFNGNDGIVLMDASNNIIDAFGHGVNAKDVSYVRDLTVNAPSPVFNENDWERISLAVVQNALDDDDPNRLGVHFPPNLPPCAAPSAPATALSFTATTSSITGTFTAAPDANEYLVIRSLNSTLTALPVDGSVYNVGTAIGGGTVSSRLVSGSFTDNNLNDNTKYYYFIFALNNVSCTGGPKYLSTAYLSGNQTTVALQPCTTPTAQPSAFSITASNYNSIQGSFTPAANVTEYLVVMSRDKALTANPQNQTVYKAGDQLGGGTVVKRGTGATFTASGLAQNAMYYFYIFSLNSNCTGGPLYLTGSPLTGSQKTGKLDASNLNFYYGNLHSHSSYSDGNKDDTRKKPEDDYAFAKNSMKMDFLGISEHNHTQAGMSLANWQPGIDAAKNATTSTFLALHGMEWGVISGGGHVIVYGIDSLIGWEPGEYQIFVPKSTYTGPTGLFKIINRHGSNAIATLAHPNTTDFNNISATYDLSADSAIVGAALESGPAFSTNITYGDPASPMSYLSYYNRMLAKGYHLGATIDHDNHNMTFGRHTKARLVVMAPALTESDLLGSIKKMRFYASEDSAAKVVFSISKQPVGSIFTGVGGPVISVTAATTSPVNSIKLMYGTPGSGVNPVVVNSTATGSMTYSHDALSNLSTGYYYADIVETDGSRIITSPIWYTRDDSYVKKNQVITFSPAKTVTYGDPDFDLDARSDNPDINITYASSDTTIVKVIDDQIHILKAGTVTITASQEGNALFNPASVQQVLTVKPVQIVVTADAKQKLEGDADPALTYTSTGTLIGTDAFSGNINRAAGETPGTYAIVQGSLTLGANYAIDYRTAAFKIFAKAAGTISGTKTVALNTAAPLITFTASKGNAPFTFTYNINGGADKTVTATGTTVTVAAPTNALGTFVYTLTKIADVNSTQVQNASATITVNPLPVASISGSTSLCINSAAPVVTFTGAVGTAPYTFTYSLNGGANRTLVSTANTATLTAPSNVSGTFTYTLISVSDVYGSQNQSGNAVITVNPLPVIQILSTKGTSVSKGDVLQLSATGGTSYSWTGTEILSGQNTAMINIRPKQSGTYKVTVTNANGCTADQSISITVADDYKLEAGTLLTPNGDGINDKFIIKNVDYYPNNTLKIFDKAGRILYTKKSYNNDWDGTLNGSPLAEGTYYYVLDMGPGLGNFKGFINIIRN